MEINKNLEIAVYIHWPFCLSKCPYCNFVSVASSGRNFKEFEDSLLKDLRNSISKLDVKSIKSVFFGGGTPSLMSPKAVEVILDFLMKNYSMSDVEITLEANPATFDRKKIEDFKKSGVNRLSLGIQSFEDKNLNFLGRIYNSAEALKAAEIVSEIFHNSSLDIMYGYQGQSKKSFTSDLLRAVNFGYKHISCYRLTFEEGTLFYKKLHRGEIKDMKTDFSPSNILKDFDIFRYEISSFAQKGFECRHNLIYWKYEDYLGIGPGAHSRVAMNGNKYELIKINSPLSWKNEVQRNKLALSQFKALTEMEKLAEIVITGLRLVEGINFSDLYSKVDPDIVDKIITPEKINFLRKNRLMRNKKFQLTKSGLERMNSVIKFLLEV